MVTFTEIGINDTVIKGLHALGFENPTPVQEGVIPLILNEQFDLVSLAQTGTGKTAAFGVPLVQLTNLKSLHTQGLVLCPTRELCMQVARDLAAFARYSSVLNVVAVYGGAPIEKQIRELRRGAHIIVATPGRLHDLIRRRVVDITNVSYIVLDEADEMLQMGFQDELNAILENTPDEKRTLLFSATMPKEVARIASKYMHSPHEITIGTKNAGAENVRHEYYVAHAKDRYLALKRIVDNSPDIYGIIFCRTRLETKNVAEKLMEDGYSADALHGEMSQSQRDHVMHKFRCRNLQMLVATDVAARGLDVNDLTHVINYNLPDDPSTYTHRSGRTGRAGKSGTSVVIVHLRERNKIRDIERIVKKKFEKCRIPSGPEICKKQLLNQIDMLKNIEVNHEQINPFYAAIAESLEDLSREELVKRFVSHEFNRLLQYYRNAPDLNVSESRKERGPKKSFNRKQSAGSSGFTRFFLNVGKKDGMYAQRLIGELNGVPGLPRIKLGKIDIMQNSVFMEADSRFTNQILGAFGHVRINGKSVTIKIADKRNNGGNESFRHQRGKKAGKFSHRGKGKTDRW